MFNPEKIRADFPILQQNVHDKPLVYFDNAATTQKPHCVIEALQHFYLHDNANVNRAVHALSERATKAYEDARDKVKKFIRAKQREEIIWTKGTTEAVNLVAQSFLRPQLKPGDEILITAMEHHANIVPWQIVCEQTGALLKVVPINDQGELIFSAIEPLLSKNTKLMAFTAISNVLGTLNPIKKIIELSHAHKVPTFVDAAQMAPHQRFDVIDWDCDFCAFSSHKCYGPTGIGVLYGKEKWLNIMPPYQTGGDMIRTVSFDKTTFTSLPHKFEAGTPNIADVIAFGYALDYLQTLDWQGVLQHETALLQKAKQNLLAIPGIKLIGDVQKASILSFVLDGVHPHDLGTILDEYGVAIRAGHHCAMPLMTRFNVPATARASFAFYNRLDEIDMLCEGIEAAKQLFAT